MRVQVDQASGPRDRRVIRGVLLQTNPHKLPQRQRVRQSPGYPTLTVDALEISDQQTPKVDPRRQRRPPELRRIELRTPLFHELIELLSFQQFVELLIEGMSRSRSHLRLGNPYPFLLLSLLARPHRHGRIIQTMRVNSSKLYRFMHQDLHHGLLDTPINFMHENRETSEAPAVQPGRRAGGEGLGRTAHTDVPEESHDGIVPMNYSNNDKAS